MPWIRFQKLPFACPEPTHPDSSRDPWVIGLIDDTHIPIQKPNLLHAELYRNRKSYLSINFQVMMGPDFKIHDLVIVCKW